MPSQSLSSISLSTTFFQVLLLSDALWSGISRWSAGVSCSGSVPFWLLVHPQAQTSTLSGASRSWFISVVSSQGENFSFLNKTEDQCFLKVYLGNTCYDKNLQSFNIFECCLVSSSFCQSCRVRMWKVGRSNVCPRLITITAPAPVDTSVLLYQLLCLSWPWGCYKTHIWLSTQFPLLYMFPRCF